MPPACQHLFRQTDQVLVRRFLITGGPGSGKTVLARELAAALGVPHIELDALYHRPGWRPADPVEFRAEVSRLIEQPGWVVDGNYHGPGVAAVVRAKTDLIIALDLPRPVVLCRLLRRTARRVLTGEELWNGNRETLRQLVNPRTSLLLYAHRTFGKDRRRAAADELASRSGGTAAVRLRSAGSVRRFVAYLTR